MSHPVFLNDAPQRRMPDGSRNEWKDFWGDGPELEANAMLPLFWTALFRDADIAWARIVDDEDLDAESNEELLAEFGDTRYPYLVTSSEEALANLAARRSMFAERLGHDYLPVLDAFSHFVAERYPHFVLLRTSGLPDVEDFEPELRRLLTDLDALQSGAVPAADNAIAVEIAYVHRHRNQDPIAMLTGSGGDWPPADLKQALSPLAAKATRATSQESTASSRDKTNSVASRVAGWVPGVVVGIATAGVYIYSRSVTAAAVCFCLICAGFIWGKRR